MADRPMCDRCRRPRVVCYCSHVRSLPTRTRVLLLQHPRERTMGVGTARMAHLALPNSVLRVGIDFANDPIVKQELSSGALTCVLFPRAGALEVAALPRDRPLTLIVLDGTWSLARKLLTRNPVLRALPHVAFAPRRPSTYRIRRQPAPNCVSTIEALAEVLTLLEPEGQEFDHLLDPFHAMVERQEWFAHTVRAQRHLRAPRAATAVPKPGIGQRLAADWSRLVCIHGEANAWPRHLPGRPEPEIVHWVACRPATGETYECTIAPRHALSPSTPRHLGLSEAQLRTGISVDGWRTSWDAFLRPDDVLCTWGTFYVALALGHGLSLSTPLVDLRPDAIRVLGARPRTIEEGAAILAQRIGGTVPAPHLDGRGGRRLAALAYATATLAQVPAMPLADPNQPAGTSHRRASA